MASLPTSAIHVPAASTSVSQAISRPLAEDAARQHERVLEYLERLRVEQGIEPNAKLRERLRVLADEWLD